MVNTCNKTESLEVHIFCVLYLRVIVELSRNQMEYEPILILLNSMLFQFSYLYINSNVLGLEKKI